MMSLVGCSEPEMANVLRGLGYRACPSHASKSMARLYAFLDQAALRARNARSSASASASSNASSATSAARTAGAPGRAAVLRRHAAAGARQDRGQDRGKDERRRDNPRALVGRRMGRRTRPRARGSARADRPRDDRRGARPPRRDSGGPALRLYATTEKKSDASAADSPFAKLLELKLGGKK